MFETGGRRLAFSALFGSHNYNLNTEKSDKDYKVFVLPTFDDLYSGNKFSTSVVTSSFDYDVHDIRKLSELFWKANINFLEVLFSKELVFNGYFKKELSFLYKNREEIARMNLPYLYDACVGMYFQKRERMYGKGTESTKELVEKYKYECKEASHAYRVLNFLERYYENNFTSFQKAIYYEENDVERKRIVNIKNGVFILEQVEDALDFKIENLGYFKDCYKSKRLNVELKDAIDIVVKNVVRISVAEECCD